MKDKKVNINVGYEKLSKEEIESQKNFGKVYESFITTKVKPMRVAKKYTLGKMMILATVTVVVTVCIWKYTSVSNQTNIATAITQSTNKAVSTTDNMAKKSFIHPPLKGINVPYKSYDVDASMGGVLVYNKSKINIPADAFCDEKGNAITGNVQIDYREFHDAIDFFVSGIPMSYDLRGKHYNFESAGMLDMQGTQNGKPVFVKEGKNIQVAMSSFQTGTKYNVYRLDTVKKNWIYMDKSKYEMEHAQQTKVPVKQKIVGDTAPAIPIQTQTEIASINKEIKKLETEKPVKANDELYKLSIDADTVTLPELAIFRNVIFEVDPSDKEYRPEWEKTDWTDAKLTKAGDATSYIFTVSKGSVKHNIHVHPAFQGANFDNAMKEYTKKYTAYEAKLAAEKEEIRLRKEAYRKRMIEESLMMVAEMEKLAKEQKEAYEKMSLERRKEVDDEKALQRSYRTSVVVVNYLNINKFGIINCDCPGNFPSKARLLATYTDENFNTINIVSVYLVEKDKNSIVPETYNGNTFVFDPDKRNFAWAVTSGNKLAIYSEEDFRNIRETKGQFTFAMKVLDNNITTISDVREALQPYMD